jgi:hypothetical protein
MTNLTAKLFVSTSLVSMLILFPVFVSQVAAREMAIEGRRGGEAVEGPGGGVVVEGPRGNVVVGTRVNVLPATATLVVVGGTTYYVDGDVYYQADNSSGEVVYVVVPAPQ